MSRARAPSPRPDPRQLGLRVPARPGEIDRREPLETAVAKQLVLPVRAIPAQCDRDKGMVP